MITKRTSEFKVVSRGLRRRQSAFTLIEMTAVVFIITVLVSLLCAALDHTKAKALRLSCLDNAKQLQGAWLLYIGDNDDILPLNQSDANLEDPRYPRSSKDSWVTGNPLQDVGSASLTHGTLYRYLSSPSVYRCPMDDSTVQGRPDVQRNRSYSMNSYLGGDPDLLPSPKYKYGQITRPESTFVFIEEHEASRWHSSFLLPTAPAKGRISASSSAMWLSTPSDRHFQGCNISFADGHVEYWRWYTPKTPPSEISKLSTTPILSVPETRDLIRLQSRLP